MKTISRPARLALAIIIAVAVAALSGCSAYRAYDATHERELGMTGSYDGSAYSAGVTYKITPLGRYGK